MRTSLEKDFFLKYVQLSLLIQLYILAQHTFLIMQYCVHKSENIYAIVVSKLAKCGDNVGDSVTFNFFQSDLHDNHPKVYEE